MNKKKTLELLRLDLSAFACSQSDDESWRGKSRTEARGRMRTEPICLWDRLP